MPLYSKQTAVSDGTLVSLLISIDFLDRDEIHVYANGIEDGAPWTWGAGNQIVFSPAVPNGVTILVQRLTDLSKIRHAFSLGAAFTAPILDEDLKQVLHIAQEATERDFGPAQAVRDDLASADPGKGTDMIAYDRDGTPVNLSTALDEVRANTATAVSDSASAVSTANAASAAVAGKVSTAALAATTGASLVGIDGTTLDLQVKNRLLRVCTDYAQLRGLDKTKYTVAAVLSFTSGFCNLYAYDSTDTTSADNNGETIVATDGGRWKIITNKARPAGFFVGNGSKPVRFGDKMLQGDAVAGDGAFPGTAHDWLYNYQNPFYSVTGNTPPSNTTGMVALAGGPGSPFPGQAILGGASSAAAGAPGGNAIGVQGYGVAQSALGSDFAWGFYGEGHRATSNTGNCYGAEICVVNRGPTKVNTPYFSENGITIGLQVDSGVGFTSAQMSGITKASSAIVVVENADGTIPFLNGLVFQATSLDGTNGNDSGHGEAIVMAKGHRVRWYKPGNVAGPVITSDVGGAAQNTNLVFTDFGLQVQNASSQPIVQFANSANSKNGFQINTADGSGNVSIEVIGVDANVSLRLAPKGTGLVQFGTAWASGSGSPNGYILVLDAAGNQRKLATIP
ncbi:MAG TPA: hypothetical protein VM783_17830 [Candidatus Acidoferrum sp.]|nr:hypothetical protein [Candidatus Acidoferrum sp.]